MNSISPSPSSSCPLCKARGDLFLKIPDPVYGQQFDVHQCSSCATCYTNPQPSPGLLSKIYSGEYWLRGEKTANRKSAAGLVQQFNRMRLAAMVNPLVRRLNPGDRILEVGCGSGQLAFYLKECGFDVEVTDVSQEILTEIANKCQIEGYCGDLGDILFNGQRYNAIIFNNVLEHLDAPDRNLQKACHLLVSGGLIFIEVPNIAGAQFRIFKHRWFPLQLPEHLFHFSPDSLQAICLRCGLQRVWLSTFSPRVSPAGYVASLFPALRPDSLRRSMSKPLLGLYLGLQLFFLPVAFFESLVGMGSAVRVMYRKLDER